MFIDVVPGIEWRDLLTPALARRGRPAAALGTASETLATALSDDLVDLFLEPLSLLPDVEEEEDDEEEAAEPPAPPPAPPRLRRMDKPQINDERLVSNLLAQRAAQPRPCNSPSPTPPLSEDVWRVANFEDLWSSMPSEQAESSVLSRSAPLVRRRTI